MRVKLEPGLLSLVLRGSSALDIEVSFRMTPPTAGLLGCEEGKTDTYGAGRVVEGALEQTAVQIVRVMINHRLGLEGFR